MTTGYVLVYDSEHGMTLPPHVRSVIAAVAESIATLKQYEFAGRFSNSSSHPSASVYYIPDDTLTAKEASKLGIRGPLDFFGGVVPKAFVKTKAITHGLIDDRAERPDGWSIAFSEKVRHVVHPGYTAFTPADAREAAAKLLALGPVRLKPPQNAGGKGQAVVDDLAGINAFLQSCTSDELLTWGLALEMNLSDVTTLNIGQVQIGSAVMSYYGTQQVTIGIEGEMEYGGSDLTCVSGGWDALYALPLTTDIRIGIDQARAYDEATSEYSGFLASRRNYDVGQGRDAKGRHRSGVLEASWRIGAASTAELAALTAFAQDPDVRIVEASAVKACGPGLVAPERATVHFHGEDTEAGPLIRYTMITRTVSSCIQERLHGKR